MPKTCTALWRDEDVGNRTAAIPRSNRGAAKLSTIVPVVENGRRITAELPGGAFLYSESSKPSSVATLSRERLAMYSILIYTYAPKGSEP